MISTLCHGVSGVMAESASAVSAITIPMREMWNSVKRPLPKSRTDLLKRLPRYSYALVASIRRKNGMAP